MASPLMNMTAEATPATSELDPPAHLIVAQRVAPGLAEARGLNPDQPRHLTRPVALPTV